MLACHAEASRLISLALWLWGGGGGGGGLAARGGADAPDELRSACLMLFLFFCGGLSGRQPPNPEPSVQNLPPRNFLPKPSDTAGTP